MAEAAVEEIDVRTFPPLERVVAAKADDKIGTERPGQGVIAPGAVDGVVAGSAGDGDRICSSIRRRVRGEVVCNQLRRSNVLQNDVGDRRIADAGAAVLVPLQECVDAALD